MASFSCRSYRKTVRFIFAEPWPKAAALQCMLVQLRGRRGNLNCFCALKLAVIGKLFIEQFLRYF
jgi:hypothetical protein